MPSPSTNPPKPPTPPTTPVPTVVPGVHHPRRLSPSEGWFAPHAPKHKRRHHRRRKRIQQARRFLLPAIVLLLGIATGWAAFKMYVLDPRKNKVTPTQTAANTAKHFAILDAEMYGYENAVVNNRVSLLNLYSDGLLLDASVVANTYSNRLRPEVAEAMRRTNFDLNAHVAPSKDSGDRLYGELAIDPASIIRSRTNRPNIQVDGSDDLVRVAVVDEGRTGTTHTQLAKVDRDFIERPRPLDLEPKPGASAPRVSTTTSIGQTGVERAPAPPDPQARYKQALRLYASGNLKDAQEMCEQLEKDAPGLKGVKNTLGEIYSRQRRWDDAVKQFESAIQEDPNNAEYQNNLALVYSQLNQDQRAEEHFALAQKLDPMNATIMLNYAWHYRKLKNYTDALKYLDLALVVDPNNAQARNKRVQTLLDLKRYADVEQFLQSQLATNPRDTQTILMMAVLYARQGEVQNAVEWLQKAEPVTGRPGLLAMLEKINDFDPIKEAPAYKEYLASLKPAS